MRALSELPAARWSVVEGLATDLDDTLTEHGCLVPEAMAALAALDRAGVPCVVATGRPVGWAEVLAGLLPVRAVVAENGGAWAVREGRGVRVAFLEDEATRVQGLKQANAMVDRLLQDHPGLARVPGWTARATDVTVDVGERAEIPRAQVERMLAEVRAAGLHAVASTVHLHVSARAPDKMAGLRAAVAGVGLDPTALDARWVYVGDSPNDEGPFGAMALSVGVAGVRRFVGAMAALPRYVTEGGAGAGFAEVAAALLAHRGDRGR